MKTIYNNAILTQLGYKYYILNDVANGITLSDGSSDR